MESFPPKLISEFTVSFDGKSIEDNTIDAEQLANSLLGISSLLEISNKQINGTNSQIFVKVKGNFKPGSFTFDVVALMTAPIVIALVNTVDVIGFTGKAIESVISYFEFIRQMKGKQITDIRPIDHCSSEVIVHGDNNGIVAPNSVIYLYNNIKARQEVERAILPLKQEGTDIVEFNDPIHPPIRITKEEFEYFIAPEPEFRADENVAYFTITQPNLNGKPSGWRLSFDESGEDDFRADVSDEIFLKKVKSGYYRFANGDSIKAEYIRVQQKRERRTNQFTIRKIIEYNDRPTNLDSLDSYNNNKNSNCDKLS